LKALPRKYTGMELVLQILDDFDDLVAALRLRLHWFR
jgi:hypothetical protein